jgi:single-stranded-DNA-specific exonuclease
MPYTHRTTWDIAPYAPTQLFSTPVEIPPLVAQVLWARGMTDFDSMQRFLAPEPDTADPLCMQDIQKAIERILQAIAAGEQIAIYGDYDCDGVTACALLHQALGMLGAHVRVYIPNRFEEGYGLHAEALDHLRGEGVGLVVTVDCGARAKLEAAHAHDIGLDLIVTDHHEVGDGVLSGAYAVVNPHRADCAYPFKLLAGVGVAYRLAQGLFCASPERLHGQDVAAALEPLLDLVALGTVADVVPLVGENRQLVRAGLLRINSQPRPGVRFLALAARVKPGAITAQTVGFTLGPRLNAAGRLDTAQDAYDLLSTEDESLASQIALRLNERNTERQQITATVAHHAEQAAFADGDEDVPLLFASDGDYNAGVIGLAAARLVERFYRPAVVVTIRKDDGKEPEARGSCRSVDGFDITAALDECRDLLGRYGGHAAAAGFTMQASRVDELRERLVQIARRQQPGGGWTRPLRMDAQVRLPKLSWDTYAQLARLEPYGMSNPRPIFAACGVTLQSFRCVGQPPDQPPHLQLRLKDARGAIWEAIGWRMAERARELSAGAKIDVAFQLDSNEWNGQRKLQLVLQDFRPAESDPV